jgi:hypothetical protein
MVTFIPEEGRTDGAKVGKRAIYLTLPKVVVPGKGGCAGIPSAPSLSLRHSMHTPAVPHPVFSNALVVPCVPPAVLDSNPCSTGQ